MKYASGNWVNYNGKNYQLASINSDETIRLKTDDVSHENYHNGSIGCFDLKSIKPVIITEDWLNKFGFRIISEYGKFANVYRLYDEDALWIYEDGSVQMKLPKLRDLKYIHELQNLYWDLYGKELTIK